MDATYSFTPRASDPDNDPLTYSIENKPEWATFDTSTGTLSGVPDAGTEGRYANIRISVSDGQLSARTPTFSVDVTQVAMGSVTLTWVPPAQNEDGTALTDLSAYKIYYGTESRNYTESIQVDNPGIASYVVENLSPNSYYFALTAVDSQAVESGYSNEVVEVVN